ncbi:MAG: hypothetical protein H6707_21385 [Deltaproteobacteria bacterium]|nr:hypothetical protein [Deltaproteobacteria bacterium]
MPQHKRKLRNYLLDWKYQLTFTMMMVMVSGALTAGLGYVWYGEMRKASKIERIRALSKPASVSECDTLCRSQGAIVSDADLKQLEEDLRGRDRLRLVVLIGFGLAFSLILAMYGIIVTHKVAGPLHKVSREMHEVAEDRLHPMSPLRKGDQLRDFYDVFLEMHEALRSRLSLDVEVIDRAVAAFERQGQLSPEANAEIKALRKLRDDKARSLEGADEEETA